MEFGYFLSSEEHPPVELVHQAQLAQDHGFDRLWISDHYHPWNAEQGESPFVWSVIGALSQVCSLPVTTAVTCPTTRIHPAVVAQAAATSARLLPGGFALGIGTGEALNEHVTGQRWPSADVRLDMLAEAVVVMRRLWSGEKVYHRGDHFEVEDARLFTAPERGIPVLVSGFGPKAIDLAAHIGDGFVSTRPNPDDVAAYRSAGGRGPTEAGVKVCWAADRDDAVDTAHRLWATQGLPGELAQVLPSPEHFEQASSLVTRESTAASVPCGPDPQPYVDVVRRFADAGYDRLHVGQMGPDQEGFFAFWNAEVAPQLTDLVGTSAHADLSLL